jgi:hypothetical protein
MTNRSLLTTVRGLAFVATVLLLSCTASARAQSVGRITLPDTVPDLPPEPAIDLRQPPAAPGVRIGDGQRPLGVHVELAEVDEQLVEQVLASGLGAVRLGIPYPQFSGPPAEVDWQPLELAVARFEITGIRTLPVITADDPEPEAFGQFCGELARRFGRPFDAYQILDNINIALDVTSNDYARLLAHARTEISLNDPGAYIVSGGIRGNDLVYLRMLAEADALRHLDAIALNLYPTQGAIEQTHSGTLGNHSLPMTAEVVEWAQQHGLAVWVTSFGISTAYNWLGVDQAVQAAQYSRGALYLGWLGVERIIYAQLHDTDPDYRIPGRCMGLIDTSGNGKASFYGLASLAAILNGAYHIRAPFSYEGSTYQLPEADDLWIAAEDGFREALPTSDDPIGKFQIRNLPVFAYWLYAPEADEYRMVYWVASQPRYPLLLSLRINTTGLAPVERFILLDNAPARVEHEHAQNFLYIPYQPVSYLPGVIRFEVID